MKTLAAIVVAFAGCSSFAADIRDENCGARLPGGGDVAIWSVESGWKVGRTKSVPTNSVDAISICAARNESEASQIVVTPARPLQGLTITAEISGVTVEILRVGYVNIAKATDKYGATGLWPDPILPVRGPIDLEANQNQPFWIRVSVPADAQAGVHSGTIKLSAGDWKAEIPVRVEVLNFALPDKLTCETALGFNAGMAFRYHGAKTEAQKRQVLEMYWRTFASHHISPYDFAPLDPIRVTWPDVKPPKSDWDGVRIATNEVHSGSGALVLFDDKKNANVNAVYDTPVAIPKAGMKLSFAYRTALPGHEFIVAISHYDETGKFIPGHNRDISFEGNGRWQTFEESITNFPADARTFRFSLYATTYSDEGEKTGLVWFDDVHLTDLATGAELVKGGDFEPGAKRSELVAPREQLEPKLDFTAWDREMERVISKYHFSTFRLHLEGMGGGTYEGHSRASLRGFTEDDPEYEIMFGSYVRQVTEHLRAKGWLDMAYTYWFDEPEPSQYDFVRGGFEKLRRLAPGLRGMLTEQVEPKLIDGPSLWCPVSSEYNHERAEERRKAGEHFWWYICCGPKGPYATEFIDHAGTSQRAWLWQTWQRQIEGILIWEVNYWTSPSAYPDAPQNPYDDPMSWVSSGTPGAKHPWGNGDGRFIYPPEAAANGKPAAFVSDPPVDSIRWEGLRDGLEDYEYLAMLRRLLAAHPERRSEFEKLLEVLPEISSDAKHYTKSPVPIESRRIAIARTIESLSR